MSPNPPSVSRVRAYLRFILAVLWFFLALGLAHRGALGLATEAWQPLVEQGMLVFLLLTGYAGMGMMLDRQQYPLRAQGLPRREGWLSECGLGVVAGWAIAVVCVLPLLIGGGIAVVLILERPAWAWLLADAAFFALLALAEEVAFRGYGFQRFLDAVGPLGATLGFAAFYAIVQALVPGSNHASFAVSLALSLLLSMAYLRSRALWVSWGINFAWKASRALLFGLAVNGVNSHSPVVQGNPMGPLWLTGGGFGLDGSWVTCAVLLAALPVVYRLTRELDYRYNAPVIVAGGIAVDLDAAARSQHEAGIAPTAPVAHTTSASGLVQILPAVEQASPQPQPPPTSN
ncbi:MAG: CPBP family glutamic-type intramembrane protease [Terracidiphilus sp.]